MLVGGIMEPHVLAYDANGNIITYYFAVSQDEYNINRQFKDLTYEGWLAYGIY